jgi:hypothetical protein
MFIDIKVEHDKGIVFETLLNKILNVLIEIRKIKVKYVLKYEFMNVVKINF